jgi:hypothetical protein
MVSVFLAVHLIGAGGVGTLMIGAVTDLLRRAPQRLHTIAALVGVGTGVQLVTGSLLVLAEPNGFSVFRFCANIGLYLGLVAAVETMLWWRLRTARAGRFPFRLTFSSVSVGTMVAALSLVTLIVR